MGYVTGIGVEHGPAMGADGVKYAPERNASVGMVGSWSGLKGVEAMGAGPVLARRKNLRTYLGEQEAAIFSLEGHRWIVVRQSDASGDKSAGLGIARMGK